MARGERPRHAVLDVQRVEEVRRDRGQRAVGEVEDARGLVGQHQADAGEAVDGPGDQSEDHERQQRGCLPRSSSECDERL